MRKVVVSFICLVLILGFAAANNGNNKANFRQGNLTNESNQGLRLGIKERIKIGNITSVEGKKIAIQKTLQNRLKIRVKNKEAITGLNLTMEDIEGNKTRLRAILSNGRNAEIKIMPDVASERAIERLRLRVCSEENNCTIELKEVGTGNQIRTAYEVRAEKQARLLGIFKTRMRVMAEVSAENGEVIKVKKPWWAFLAVENE